MPNIEYNRAGRPRQYISIQKHHHTSRWKNASKWISYDIEKDTFDAADYGNHNRTEDDQPWLDDRGNLWGFLNDLIDVGSKGEVFGFFDRPRNISDRWHGYPIFPFAPKAIPRMLIQHWIDEEILDEDDIISLIKKKKMNG